MQPENAAKFCGVLQGDWGFSTVFKDDIGKLVLIRLSLTGKLMFWVMLLMIPSALIIGILACMREGSRTDRTLSTVSITTTATPEYVSGVIFIAVFSSTAFGLKWFKGTATKAMEYAKVISDSDESACESIGNYGCEIINNLLKGKKEVNYTSKGTGKQRARRNEVI